MGVQGVSIITTVILRMPLAYLLAYLTKSPTWPNGHPDAIFSSLMISWVVGTALTALAYRLGFWRRRLPEELR